MDTFCAMRLSDWLRDNDITPAEFGRRIGARSRMTVPRYLDGSRKPDGETMAAIYAATGGAVTPNDFYDLPPLPEGVAEQQGEAA